jgi:hypothetical protein
LKPVAKKKTAHLVPYQFRAAAAPQTIVVRTRRAPAKAHKKPHRRRHHSGGLGGALGGLGHLAPVAAGAFALGLLDRQGTKFPTIEVLGRAGSIAVAAHFAAKFLRMPVLRDVSIAAAAVALYEYGSTGKVVGGVVRQV